MNSDEQQQLKSWLYDIATDRDKNAFTALFSWFAPKIIQFGIQKLNTESAANELLQETMTNIWRKAHLFNGDKGEATTWVYSIMRNLSFDMLRKVRSNREDTLSEDIWPMAEAQLVQEDSFDDHLMSSNLLKNIDILPEAQKEVVKGLYLEEMSQEQLATKLAIPLGTVKSRLRLALIKLKQQIGESK
ncbi:sigma-70 family RNA polymerase sigma factor [Pseudocolwellia sp. AS88]|uniref:sigma-70 family RNA polymerase sigma factor n=1 Tax=Pseudocolwellia sp. AS88 TaxID=3063958 RepID=UPI0026EC5BFC|nr:sigma-70 family RNA polymerase sigma factor [Pseudocolwellia sp. AS88]MDO7083743.1 sigma-70 family RNA polymerase sigma factor [Pseudocolwellia sp. AS88]